jgi:thioredoxin-like negative regulator of GroEL
VYGTLIVMKLSIVVLGVVAVAGCAASADQPVVAPSLDHHAQVHSTEAVAVENASHLDRGLQLYSEENYAEAAREFEQAYSLAPAPSLLLAQAQALRLAGACEEAAPLYEAFLREAEPTHGTAVRKLARDCR